MSLSCLRAVDPNIRNVDKLYDSNYDDGHLYLGHGSTPLCSATAPPPPSSCVVCLQQFIYSVCSNLEKNATLAMEGGGRPIDLMKSDCPGLLGDATNEDADWSADHKGDLRWLWLLLLLLLFVIMAVLLVAFYKLRKRRRTQRNQEVWRIDSTEVEPVTEAAE